MLTVSRTVSRQLARRPFRVGERCRIPALVRPLLVFRLRRLSSSAPSLRPRPIRACITRCTTAGTCAPSLCAPHSWRPPSAARRCLAPAPAAIGAPRRNPVFSRRRRQLGGARSTSGLGRREESPSLTNVRSTDVRVGGYRVHAAAVRGREERDDHLRGQIVVTRTDFTACYLHRAKPNPISDWLQPTHPSLFLRLNLLYRRGWEPRSVVPKLDGFPGS